MINDYVLCAALLVQNENFNNIQEKPGFIDYY